MKVKKNVYEELGIFTRIVNHTRKKDNVKDICKISVSAAKRVIL